MNTKLITLGVITYIGLSTLGILSATKRFDNNVQELVRVADTNHNDKLELSEVQEAYRRMGIDFNALFEEPYFRLTHDEYRVPNKSDLEKAISSYKL